MPREQFKNEIDLMIYDTTYQFIFKHLGERLMVPSVILDFEKETYRHIKYQSGSYKHIYIRAQRVIDLYLERDLPVSHYFSSLYNYGFTNHNDNQILIEEQKE